MRCDDVQPQLTGYLDGDLDADAGTIVRGHLRECQACRDVAAEEAALRDGLRALPSLDPPPALWNAVRAQLAKEEVEASRLPAWRRALTRWMPQMRAAAPFAGALAAAVVALVLWQKLHATHDDTVAITPPPPPVVEKHAPAPAPREPVRIEEAPDVTADLALDGKRKDASFEASEAAMKRELVEVRRAWSASQNSEFEARVAELEGAVKSADAGRAREKAERALFKYLQNALTRDEVAIR